MFRLQITINLQICKMVQCAWRVDLVPRGPHPLAASLVSRGWNIEWCTGWGGGVVWDPLCLCSCSQSSSELEEELELVQSHTKHLSLQFSEKCLTWHFPSSKSTETRVSSIWFILIRIVKTLIRIVNAQCRNYKQKDTTRCHAFCLSSEKCYTGIS